MSNGTNLLDNVRATLRQQLGAAGAGDVEQLRGLKALDPIFEQGLDLEVVTPEEGGYTETTRLTFSTPGERTTLSLGAASADRTTDEGLYGRTDRHLMLEVADGTQTFVSLGGSSTYGVEIGSLGLTSRSAVGYAMVTEGDAWHESRNRHYLLAREGDWIGRAMGGGEVLVQSDSGEGTVASGGNMHVATQSALNLLAAPDLELEKPGYQENVAGEVASTVERKVSTWVHTIFDQGQTIYGLLTSPTSLKGLPKPGEDGFKMATAKAVAPILADAAKGWYWLISQFLSDPNSGTLAADGGVTMAGANATVWGTTGAGLGSLVSADVVGGTAGVKAATYAGLWAGLAVSIEGRTQVSLSAPNGDVEIEAATEVKIGSEDGKVLVGSENGLAQLTGKDLFLHGGERAHLGSGKGSGFCVAITPSKLQVGRAASNANQFQSVSCEAKKGLTLEQSKVALEMDDTKITLDDGELKLKTKGKINLKASNVAEIDGKKVLLA